MDATAKTDKRLRAMARETREHMSQIKLETKEFIRLNEEIETLKKAGATMTTDMASLERDYSSLTSACDAKDATIERLAEQSVSYRSLVDKLIKAARYCEEQVGLLDNHVDYKSGEKLESTIERLGKSI